MVDTIDELKRKYTDKFVVVDKSRPELARFCDTYGQVRTVNMSGRALVEFADYHLNIGWYDIDPMFLTVVDKPPPPKPKEAPSKEPAAKKSAGEVASAAEQKAAKPTPKPAAGKQSTADILAALRGGGAVKTTGEPASAGGGAASKPPTPKPAASPAKVDRSKMSVADMLAAARAGGSVGNAPAAPAPVEEEAPTGELASASGDAPAPAKKSSGEKVDKKSMSIDQMIAWCREHDAK